MGRRVTSGADGYEVGQAYRKRSMPWITFRIERLAGRSAFGPMWISGVPLVVNGQVRYSKLRAKYERCDATQSPGGEQ